MSAGSDRIARCGAPNGVNRSESGCRDLNPGPLDPQSSALTKLRHSPWQLRLYWTAERRGFRVRPSRAGGPGS